MTTINIDSNVSGQFIIDEVGIRSVHPVSIKEWYWESGTLYLKGNTASINNFGNSVCVNNCSIVGSIINYGTNSGSIYNNGIDTCISNDSDKKMVDVKWVIPFININKLSCSGVSTYVVNNTVNKIKLSGSVTLELKYTEYRSVEINTSGSSTVTFNKTLINTCRINSSGACKIRGKKSICENMYVNVSGACKISQFLVEKICDVDASGACTVDIETIIRCRVKKRSSGCCKLNVKAISESFEDNKQMIRDEAYRSKMRSNPLFDDKPVGKKSISIMNDDYTEDIIRNQNEKIENNCVKDVVLHTDQTTNKISFCMKD